MKSKKFVLNLKFVVCAIIYGAKNVDSFINKNISISISILFNITEFQFSQIVEIKNKQVF